MSIFIPDPGDWKQGLTLAGYRLCAPLAGYYGRGPWLAETIADGEPWVVRLHGVPVWPDALEAGHQGLCSGRVIARTPAGCLVAAPHIRGETLADRMLSGPLAVNDIERLADALLDALSHMHAGGWLHLDISPANIMLRDGDSKAPVLIDFDTAVRTAAISDHYSRGKPSYGAPEQLAASTAEIGPACDLFGLGASLIAALTGTPFRRSGVADSAVQPQYQPIAPWLGRLVEPAIADRPPSAAAARREIAAFCQAD